ENIVKIRITNDERPLRRVIKKFHSYVSAANPPPAKTPEMIVVEEARESFLVELESLQLALRKNFMICEAEARQVEEYERERRRLELDYGTLRGQIEQLKTSLEHAIMERRRRMEYDNVAEKVNSLPSRDELERSVSCVFGSKRSTVIPF
ncbi:hypothetical protein FISHEDRAFT_41644, partial [Fistulina hepatica ATCC 64428]